MSYILGCDMSAYQGSTGASTTLFNNIHAAGGRWGIFRASIGLDTDTAFATNRTRGLAKGWVVGAYHMLYRAGLVSLDEQAHLLVNRMTDTGGVSDCLAVVDIEIGGVHWADVQGFVAAFRTYAPNHPLGIYTRSSFWGGIGNPNGAAIVDYLWDARWPGGLNPANLPAIPPTGGYGHWPRPVPMWQFGPIIPRIDGNAWYGTLDALKSLGSPTDGPPPPPPPPDPGGTPKSRWFLTPWDVPASRFLPTVPQSWPRGEEYLGRIIVKRNRAHGAQAFEVLNIGGLWSEIERGGLYTLDVGLQGPYPTGVQGVIRVTEFSPNESTGQLQILGEWIDDA